MEITGAEPQRIYEDFEPFCKWHKRDAVEIHVQGFKKEELRVQTNNLGILTIHGERALNETTWSRFHKEIKLPENCDTNEIRAKLAGGVLTVTMPQKVTVITPKTADPRDKSVIPPSADQDNEKPKPSINQITDKVTAKLQPQNAALLDHQKADQDAGQRSLVSGLKEGKVVALKLAVVVAVVVAFGLGAYLKYKHGQPYRLEN